MLPLISSLIPRCEILHCYILISPDELAYIINFIYSSAARIGNPLGFALSCMDFEQIKIFDLVFKCITARRIPAHQYVLISGSPVFYSMFCGDMRERGEVKVPDITPDTFTQMLRWVTIQICRI